MLEQTKHKADKMSKHQLKHCFWISFQSDLRNSKPGLFIMCSNLLRMKSVRERIRFNVNDTFKNIHRLLHRIYLQHHRNHPLIGLSDGPLASKESLYIKKYKKEFVESNG